MKTPQYIVDETGKKISVVLPIEDYNALLEELDEAYCVKLYDKAVQLQEPKTSLEEYLKNKPDA